MNSGEEKRTILLVDDAPANIQVAREILKDTYKTGVATSGAKALELVRVPPGTGPDPPRCHDAGDGWLRGMHEVKADPITAIYRQYS